MQVDDFRVSTSRWGEVPALPDEPKASLLLHFPLAVVVLGATPLSRAIGHPWIDELPMVLIALATIGLGAVPWIRRRSPVLILSAAAGAAGFMVEGPLIAVWFALGAVVSLWGILRIKPWPGAPDPNSVAPVVAAVAAVHAGYTARVVDTVLTPTIALVGALLAVFTGARWNSHGSFVDRLGSALSRAASRAAFTVIGLGTAVLPWALGRVFRHDPLRSAGGWERTTRGRLDPGRSWSPQTGAAPRPSISGAMTTVTALAVVMALVVTADAAMRPLRTRLYLNANVAYDMPPPFSNSPWYPRYVADFSWISSDKGLSKPFGLARIDDVSSRYINVTDGTRRSWQPPPCTCERLTLWMYGGSTVFGLGQRDEHTIASELARAAWADGIAVDVVNRGQLGRTHENEAVHLAWDLSRYPAPDLVVFYDGVNEIWAGTALSNGEGDVPFRYDPFTDLLANEGQNRTGGTPPQPPPGAELPEPEDHSNTWSLERTGQLGALRYLRALEASRAVANQAGIAAHWYWQPSIGTRPIVASEDLVTPEHHAGAATTAEAARAELRDPVVDLADVLDEVTEPLFFDDVHHNELGATFMAEAIYRDLEQELRGLAAG